MKRTQECLIIGFSLQFVSETPTSTIANDVFVCLVALAAGLCPSRPALLHCSPNYSLYQSLCKTKTSNGEKIHVRFMRGQKALCEMNTRTSDLRDYLIRPGNASESPRSKWKVLLGVRASRISFLVCCHHDLTPDNLKIFKRSANQIGKMKNTTLLKS